VQQRNRVHFVVHPTQYIVQTGLSALQREATS
jgi:hypothetical protein